MAKKTKKSEELKGMAAVIDWFKTLFGAIIVVMLINGAIVASFVVPTASMERTVMTGDFLFVNKFLYGPTTPQIIPFVNIPIPFYKFPGVRKPELNDVIVFIYPGNRDEIEASVFNYYLKRCCGTPGDTVQLKDKQLYVNGKKVPLAPNGVYIPELPDHPANFPFGNSYSRDNYGPLRIPKAGDVIKLNPEHIRIWDVLIKREGAKEVTTNGTDVIIDGKVATTYTIKRNYYFGMGDNRDNSEDSRSWGFIPEDNIIGTPLFVYWSWDTNLPLSSIVDKLISVRWSRIGNIIR